MKSGCHSIHLCQLLARDGGSAALLSSSKHPSKSDNNANRTLDSPCGEQHYERHLTGTGLTVYSSDAINALEQPSARLLYESVPVKLVLEFTGCKLKTPVQGPSDGWQPARKRISPEGYDRLLEFSSTILCKSLI
jgi:hypothetical protein